MIDKQNYYHGAAIISIVEHFNCEGVRKFENGFLVNEEAFVFLKYCTKNRSPWQFSFSEYEIEQLKKRAEKIKAIFIGLICGGDGICAINLAEILILIKQSGWISAKRNFHEQYLVSGPEGELKQKVPFKRWPQIIFD